MRTDRKQNIGKEVWSLEKDSKVPGTIVERKTGYTCIVKLKDHRSATVGKQFVKEFKALSKKPTKTMTHDNGVEMAQHKEPTRQSGVAVYFAHRYAFWERGTNESTNGLIRRYFPKGTDFDTIKAKQFKRI